MYFSLFVLGAIFLSNSHHGRAEDLSKYTPEQQLALARFRETAVNLGIQLEGRLTNFLNSSLSATFLEARDFNVEEAVQDGLAALKWRKDNQVDDILDIKTGFAWKDYPFYIDGTDAEGRPIIIIKAGEWDIRRSFIVNTPHNISMYVLQAVEMTFEKVIKYNKATGQDISQVVLVLDMHGYNLRQTGCVKCIAAYVEWVTYFELYYKGFIKDLYVINVPRVFAPVIRLLLPIVSEHTRRMVHIFGPRREEWQQALLQSIPAEQLHISYGGTKKRLNPSK